MPVDSEKNRARVKQWKKDNPEKTRINNAIDKKRHPQRVRNDTKRKRDYFRQVLYAYKVICGCMDCGEHFLTTQSALIWTTGLVKSSCLIYRNQQLDHWPW
jgi:hypothetical protein